MTKDGITLFYSYSHRDQDLRDELEKHLSALIRSGTITGWHDRRIDPGAEWSREIDEHVGSAEIILLLISSDFIASDYCHNVEMRRALERHSAGNARVIPIILRPVDWKGTGFSHLQALPQDAKPVTTWDNLDEAFRNIAEGVRAVVADFRKLQRGSDKERFQTLMRASCILEAAVPAQMPTGVARDVVAMISTDSSARLTDVLMEDQTYTPRPDDVKCQPFELEFSTELDSIPVLLRLWSPDFEPVTQQAEVTLNAKVATPPLVFFISAAKAGRDLLLKLDLLIENRLITTRLLRTNTVPLPGAEPAATSAAEPAPRQPPHAPQGWAVMISVPLTVQCVEAYSSAPATERKRK